MSHSIQLFDKNNNHEGNLVSIDNLLNCSDLLHFQILELYDENHYCGLCLHSNFVDTLRFDEVDLIKIRENGDVKELTNTFYVVPINKKFMDEMMNENVVQNTENYIFRRIMLNIIPKYTKKFEMEISFIISQALRESCIFIYQKNILGYHPDICANIIIKNKYLTEIPTLNLLIEVDEDGHKAYDKKNERYREEVLQATTFRIFRISISRDVLVETLNINNQLDELKSIVRSLVMTYSPHIETNELVEVMNANNSWLVDFIHMFNHTTDDIEYPYPLWMIASYFGYSRHEKNGYNHLIDGIIYQLSKGIHYKIITGKEGLRPDDFDPNDGKSIPMTNARQEWRKLVNGQPLSKNGRIASNRKTYRFSRLGLYTIAMISDKDIAKEARNNFGQVYEVALKIIARHKANILVDAKKQEGARESFIQRTMEKKEENDKKTKINMLKQENEELKKENNILQERLRDGDEKFNNLYRDTFCLQGKYDLNLVKEQWRKDCMQRMKNIIKENKCRVNFEMREELGIEEQIPSLFKYQDTIESLLNVEKNMKKLMVSLAKVLSEDHEEYVKSTMEEYFEEQDEIFKENKKNLMESIEMKYQDELKEKEDEISDVENKNKILSKECKKLSEKLDTIKAKFDEENIKVSATRFFNIE